MADEKVIRVNIDGSQAKEGVSPVVEALDAVKTKADEAGAKVDQLSALVSKQMPATGITTATDSLQQMSQQSDSAGVSLNKLQSVLTQRWTAEGPKSVADSIRDLRSVTESGKQSAEDLKRSFDGGWNASGPKSATSALSDMQGQLNSTKDAVDRTKAALTQGGWSSQIEKASEALKGQSQAAKEAETSVSALGKAHDKMASMIGSANSALSMLKGGLGSVISVASAVGGVLKEIIPIDLLAEAGQKFFEVTNRLQGFLSTMTVVTGSVSQSRTQLQSLFDIASKYGVNVTTLTDSFAKLSAAAKGTTLEGDKITKVFESIVVASSAMHLSAEDTRLVLYALQQMVSKGTVSFEELRRQMAERFPGAMTIAAQSMGMTQQAFQDLVKSGKLFTEDFLPGFAQGILQQFSPALEVSSKSLLAAVNRMQNAWEQLIMKLSTSELTASITHSIDSVREAISKISDSTIATVGNGLAKIIDQFVGFLGTIDANSINKFFEAFAAALQLVGAGLQFVVGLMIDAAPQIKGLADRLSLFAQIINTDALSGWQKFAVLLAIATGHIVDASTLFTSMGDDMEEATKKALNLGTTQIKVSEDYADTAGKTKASFLDVMSSTSDSYSVAFSGMTVTSNKFFADQSKNWAQWGDQVSRQAAAARNAVINMSGDSGDQVSRMLQQQDTGKVADRDAANQTQRLIDLSGQLQQARTKALLQLKDEVTVRQRLKDVLAEINTQEKIRDDPNSSLDQQTHATQILIGLTAQWATAKKAVDQADKSAAKSQDSFNGMLGRANALFQQAQADSQALAASLDDKLLPAQKELINIQNSNVYKKLSADKQQQITDAFNLAAQLEQENQGWKDYNATINKVSSQLDQFIDKDNKVADATKNKIENLNNDEQATKGAATAELEHFLALSSTQAALDGYRAKSPAVVEAKLAEARAAAAAADAETSHYNSLKKFIDESSKETNSLNTNTKQLNERAASLALTKEQQDKNLLSYRETELALVNEALAQEKSTDTNNAYVAALLKRRDALQGNIAALKNMADAENVKQFQQTWVKAVDAVSDKFVNFINTVRSGGWSAGFKKLWDDFVNFALGALAKVALQKVAISIFPQLGTAFDEGNNGPFGQLKTLLGLNLPKGAIKVPGLDTTELQKSINDAANDFKVWSDAQKAASDAQQKLTSSTSDFGDKLNLDSQNLADFGNAVTVATSGLNGITPSVQSVSGSIDALNGSFVTASTNFEGVSEGSKNLLTSFDSANNDVTGFGTTLSGTTGSIAGFSSSAGGASNQLSALSGAATTASANLSKVDGSSKDLYGDLGDFSGSVGDASNGLANVANSSTGVVGGFGKLLQGMGGFVSSLFSLVGGLFGGGGGTGGAGNVISGVGNIFGTANNVSSGASTVARFFGITPAASGGVIGANIAGGPAGAMDMFGTLAPSAGAAGISAGSAFVGGVTAPFSTIGTAITGGIEAAGGIAAIAGAAIPIIGGVLAIAAAAGLFDKKPSPASGQFQVSTGTTGFEDNAFVAGPFGLNFGFNDANTQQFSGAGAKVFDQMVTGALAAFQTRFSPEQSAHFAETLKGMTFKAFEGTYTTEDFVQKYGGQILQQIVVAAFGDLDPALADVMKNFQGTADEVAKFANSLLAIHDGLTKIDNSGFTKTIDTALQGADQAAADKVSAFVTIVQGLTPSLGGLAKAMESIDPANVTTFIDALGGADQAVQGMSFITQNFTTAADKAVQAQNNLTEAWKLAGVTADDLSKAGLNQLPQTHAQFLQLLNSLDLNTEHGRELAAMLINTVAPAFVAVKGTADQAAQSITNLATATRDSFANIGAQALSKGPQVDTSPSAAIAFLNTDRNDILSGTYKMTDIGNAAMKFINDLHTKGIDAFNMSDDQWNTLIGSIDDTTESGHRLRQELLSARGAIDSLGDSTKNLNDFYHDTNLFTQSEIRQHDIGTDVAQFQAASKLLGVSITGNAAQYRQLVEATIAQYGADSTQAKILLALLPYIDDYNQSLKDQSDIIVTSVSAIIQANNDLKQAGADAANKFLSNIDSLVSGVDTFGDQLAEKIAMINSAIDKTGATFVSGGTVTVHKQGQPDQTIQQPDKYVVPGGDLQTQSYVDTLAKQNTTLKDQLRRFNELTLQYGDDIAQQLVELQDWKTQQYQIFVGMPDDLAIVDSIFQKKWDAIVNGSTDAAQSLDDFIKSLDSLVDSSHGTLGQRLTIELDAALSKMGELTATLAKEPVGSPEAASTQKDIDKLSAYDARLNTYIADFSKYSQQYGDDIANQLVALEQWRDTQKDTLAQTIKDPALLASAFSTVDDIFNKEFQGIIDGSKDAGNSLEDLKQKIRDFIDGLKTGDLSPLTPLQKLQSAKDKYEQDLAAAKTGDTTALSNITQDAQTYLQIARDAYASSQQYTDIFSAIMSDLSKISDYVAPAASSPVAPTTAALSTTTDLSSPQAGSTAPTTTLDALNAISSNVTNAANEISAIPDYTAQFVSIENKLDTLIGIEQAASDYTDLLNRVVTNTTTAAPTQTVESVQRRLSGTTGSTTLLPAGQSPTTQQAVQTSLRQAAIEKGEVTAGLTKIATKLDQVMVVLAQSSDQSASNSKDVVDAVQSARKAVQDLAAQGK